MEKVICITHSADLDGHVSGAIIKSKYPDAKIIGWNYGQKLPDIPNEHNIIMTDISFPIEEMTKLAGNAESFTWIDHHISAINEYKKHPKLESLITSVLPKGHEQVAACELTWRHIYPDKKLPEAIRLLGAYDCFRHKGTKEEQQVLQFQFACRALYTNPEECRQALDLSVETISDLMYVDGKAIYNYLKSEAKTTFEKGFEIDVDGHKFICLDGDRVNPINFGLDYHAKGFEGSACFWYEEDQWHFSLYNDDGKVDCSALAKKRGGGGHFGASGLELDNKQFYDFIKTKKL
jgi:oligoribonuclease NrnB/cAMP/cGMP phosphodiesterase (DHH superfamily)